MKEIRLYNTLTRKKEAFEPIDSNNVRVYACGPTVYDRIHVGNARPLVVFDVLVRLLRHRYGEDKVKYVRNITDVDDKINARASEEGISIEALTEKTIADFKADCEDLNLLAPSEEPRATGHIKEMIAMIETLIEKEHAYEAKGHVLFSVASKADYGCLSGRNREEQIAGARVEVAEFKRDAGDFILWKPSDEGQPGWDSPWGRGRPGWHIECSAMSAKYLGEVFDIHAGGQDLIFPHHENEIAQSCAAHGTERMANYWLHNGYVTSQGEKMAKSEGNFITLNDALVHSYGGVIRYALLSAQYRQPLDFSYKSLAEARQAYINLYNLISTKKIDKKDEKKGKVDKGILEALSDDLNTPKAIARLHEIAHKAKEGDSDAVLHLEASGHLLGLFKWEETISDSDNVVRLYPDYAEAYYDRGNEKVKLGKSEEAIHDYDAAIRLRPDYAEAYNKRGIAKRELRQYKEEINDYDEAIRLNPNYAEAYYNRGVANFILSQYEEAINDFGEAIRLRPDYAEAYYTCGLIKGILGLYKEAMSDYDEAIRLNPDNIRAYKDRGFTKGKLGRHEEAISDFGEVIRLYPDSAVAYNHRGIAKGELGQYEEAINDFDEAIRLKPDYAEAYSNRSAVKNNLGRQEEAISDYDEAMRFYDEAIRLEPDDGWAYYNRGIAKRKLRRYEEAINDFDEAIYFNGFYVEAYNHRGLTKEELGQHEEAISDFDEAIRLKPYDPVAYFNRGTAKWELGRYEEAIGDFDESIHLYPDYAEAYYNRGTAKKRLGLDEEAVSDFDEAIRLNPNLAKVIKKGDLDKVTSASKTVWEIGDEFSKNLLDKEKLNQHIKERNNARKKGDFKEADRIRDMLKTKYFIILEDTPEGTTWWIESKGDSFFDN